MPELVIFVGLQAAGKSTFYATTLATTHRLVSKDRFRSTRNKARRQAREVEDALQAGVSVVVDNTNPTRDERADLIALGKRYGVAVVAYYFRSVMADCLVRNAQRNGLERVPDVALFSTIKRLGPPSPAEGFEHIWYVAITDGGGFDVSPWQEDNCGSRSV